MSSWQTWTFMLGNVELKKFEVPQQFIVGHEMELKVHKYYSEDGTPSKHINVMGAFSLPTTWEGWLYGANALQRAEALDILAVAGQAINWQYGPYNYTVFIKKFEAKVFSQIEVQYTVDLEIQADLNGILSLAVANTVSFDAATQSFFDDSNAAMQTLQTSNTLPTSLNSAYSQAINANQAYSPIKNATLQEIQTLVGYFQTLTAEITAYATPLESTAVLEADLAALNNSLIALQGFGLYTTNLQQLLGTSVTAQIVSSFTGSVASLAAQYYPNTDLMTAAALIANANNLTDLFVDTAQDLTLPPVFS